MKMLIALLLLLMPISATATSLDIGLTAGMGKSVVMKKAFERVGALSLRYGNIWKVQTNGGYWFALGEGEKPSIYTSLQGGLEIVGDSGMFSTVMFGPAWIQNPDNKLSGHFQFNPAFGFGTKNERYYSLAFVWVHFSNAGIILPNAGRDLLTLQLMIPLYKKDSSKNTD